MLLCGVKGGEALNRLLWVTIGYQSVTMGYRGLPASYRKVTTGSPEAALLQDEAGQPAGEGVWGWLGGVQPSHRPSAGKQVKGVKPLQGVRYCSYLQLSLSWVVLVGLTCSGVEANAGAAGCAQVKTFGDLFYGESRLASQSGSHVELRWVALAARRQVCWAPTQAAEFLGDDALGLGFGGLLAQLAEMVFAELGLVLLEHTIPELSAAQAPAAAKGLKACLVARFQAHGFHLGFELPPSRSRVLPQTVFAQQPVHADPLRSVFRGGQVIAEAAPRIGQQSLVGLEQSGSRRVQVHVIAGGAQVAVAAAFDQLGLITGRSARGR